MICFDIQIQRMVISGGNFKPDTLKPKEVVSLLLDDEELEKKCMYSRPLINALSSLQRCFFSPTLLEMEGALDCAKGRQSQRLSGEKHFFG